MRAQELRRAAVLVAAELESIREAGLGAWLAAAAVVAGVASMLLAGAIGQGARRAALDDLGSLGLDTVIVQDAAPGAGRRSGPLTAADAAAIVRALGSGVEMAVARHTRDEAHVAGRRLAVEFAGVSPSWGAIAGLALAEGRWLADGDERQARRRAVVGADVARALAIAGPGAAVAVGGDWFTVVGILRDRHRPRGGRGAVMAFDVNRSVFVPARALDRRLDGADGPDRLTAVVIRVPAPRDVERAAGVVRSVLARRGREGAQSPPVLVPRELLAARLRTERTFGWIITAIGALALGVGGVGILNLMLARVSARRSEIGLRRAVGARRTDIICQFAAEAVVICGLAGLGGLVLGAASAGVIAQAAAWPVWLAPTAFLQAFGLALLVGLSAGLYPAWRATEVDPAQALGAPGL